MLAVADVEANFLGEYHLYEHLVKVFLLQSILYEFIFHSLLLLQTLHE